MSPRKRWRSFRRGPQLPMLSLPSDQSLKPQGPPSYNSLLSENLTSSLEGDDGAAAGLTFISRGLFPPLLSPPPVLIGEVTPKSLNGVLLLRSAVPGYGGGVLNLCDLGASNFQSFEVLARLCPPMYPIHILGFSTQGAH